MTTEERARAMRAEGYAFDSIAATLSVSLQWAYKCAGDVIPAGPKATVSTIVRHFAHNGGCSTRSGMAPVSLPRIPTLHGVAA